MNLYPIFFTIYYNIRRLLATTKVEEESLRNMKYFDGYKVTDEVDFVKIYRRVISNNTRLEEICDNSFDIPIDMPELLIPEFITEIVRGYLDLEDRLDPDYLTFTLGITILFRIFNSFSNQKSMQRLYDLVEKYFHYDRMTQSKYPNKREIAKIAIDALLDTENEWDIDQDIDFNFNYPKELLKGVYEFLSYMKFSPLLSKLDYLYGYNMLNLLADQEPVNKSGIHTRGGYGENGPITDGGDIPIEIPPEIEEEIEDLLEKLKDSLEDGDKGGRNKVIKSMFRNELDVRKSLESTLKSYVNFQLNKTHAETETSTRGFNILLDASRRIRTGDCHIFTNKVEIENKLIVLLDTSGSVGSKLPVGSRDIQIARGVTQLDCMSALSSVLLDRFLDTKIFQFNYDYSEIKTPSDLRKIPAGGGTRLYALLEYVFEEIVTNNNHIHYQILIISDGMIQDPRKVSEILKEKQNNHNFTLSLFQFGSRKLSWYPDEYKVYKIESVDDLLRSLESISQLN
ncbi:MAG: hypothetical protein GF364_13130 [Candidatus Lokiarchaeota archaeon]|nr:hypothetical protein [Candidatus Lokiarchaeota archaeon]